MPPAHLGQVGLLLDADGTLWDTHTAMHSGARAGIRAVWPALPDEEVVDAARRYRADLNGGFVRFVAGELTFAQLREERLRDLADHLCLDWSTSVPDIFGGAYEAAFLGGLALHADTTALLGHCDAAGIPVRILTNSSRDQTLAKLAAVGLASRGLEVCSRDCLGVGKPEAAVFHHACAALGSARECTLSVGDEWTSDALGAHEAGLRSAWLVRDDGDPAGEVLATQGRRDAAAAHGIPIITTLAEAPAFLADTQTHQ